MAKIYTFVPRVNKKLQFECWLLRAKILLMNPVHVQNMVARLQSELFHSSSYKATPNTSSLSHLK